MRRFLMGILALLVLIAICVSLERSISPDGTATQTESILTEAGNEFMDVLQGIADGFKSIFFASDGDVTSQKNTEIGEVSLDELPDDVQNQYDVYEHDNWETKTEDLSGRTKAGDEYKNRSKTLPETTADGDAITYKEYDAEETPDGQIRGTKRFVRGNDGKVYYTDDHYNTFKEII